MENQIKNLKDIKGKTISDFKLDSCGDMYIKFTDHTFTIFRVNDVTEGFGQTRNEVNIDIYGVDGTDHNLVELGLISKKEYNDACLKEELEYKKRQEERESEQAEMNRKRELEQYEFLKSKYK